MGFQLYRTLFYRNSVVPHVSMGCQLYRTFFYRISVVPHIFYPAGVTDKICFFVCFLCFFRRSGCPVCEWSGVHGMFISHPVVPHIFLRRSKCTAHFSLEIQLNRRSDRAIGCWLDCASELSAHDAVRQRPPAEASGDRGPRSGDLALVRTK